MSSEFYPAIQVSGISPHNGVQLLRTKSALEVADLYHWGQGLG